MSEARSAELERTFSTPKVLISVVGDLIVAAEFTTGLGNIASCAVAALGTYATWEGVSHLEEVDTRQEM